MRPLLPQPGGFEGGVSSVSPLLRAGVGRGSGVEARLGLHPVLPIRPRRSCAPVGDPTPATAERKGATEMSKSGLALTPRRE
jgi:hypothetical protein